MQNNSLWDQYSPKRWNTCSLGLILLRFSLSRLLAWSRGILTSHCSCSSVHTGVQAKPKANNISAVDLCQQWAQQLPLTTSAALPEMFCVVKQFLKGSSCFLIILRVESIYILGFRALSYFVIAQSWYFCKDGGNGHALGKFHFCKQSRHIVQVFDQRKSGTFHCNSLCTSSTWGLCFAWGLFCYFSWELWILYESPEWVKKKK